MKKIVLTFALFGAVLVVYSQTVLNEVYAQPGSGNSEFIELYNSSSFGSQNLDCFTILTYWSSGSNKGWYVLDLPNATVASKGWYILAVASPFNVQSQTGVVANVNWNTLSFRNGSTGGFLKQYQVSGSTYTDLGLADATVVSDLLVDGNFASGSNNMTLLFQNGVMINGFWGGGPIGTLPVGITGMPNLTVTPSPGSCGSAFTINFSTLGAVEFHNPSGGTDNGYARTSDGKCGSWTKTSSSVNHTPGISNGSAAGLSGSMTTAQLIICSAPRHVTFDITAITGSLTEADDFPVEVLVFNDVNNNFALDGGDIFINSKFLATVAAPFDTVHLAGSNQNANVIVVYKTKRGCFDKVVSVLTTCFPLPVKFTSFTAHRTNASTVTLVWQTSMELNSSGFEVQRNVNGNWETQTFISSKAPGGNSDLLLTYTYTDLNSARGVSQYRIKQIDFDNKSEFSTIRAVRGEGSPVKSIIYPNPSFDGRVNILFDEFTGTRDVVLTDMNGKIINQWKGISNNSLQITGLFSGMYSLRVIVRETGEQSIEKIIIERR